jgi:predicted amidophosphoribosyltransferase
MDKYGVEIEQDKTKTGEAGSSGKCPKCGRELPQDQPNYCNNCGTEPFERRPEKP